MQLRTSFFISLLFLSGFVSAGQKEKDIEIKDLSIKGRIEGENITFNLDFAARVRRNQEMIGLVSGDLVLEAVSKPDKGYELKYDRELNTYYMSWDRAGTHEVSIDFAVRPIIVEKGPWREALFSIPASQVRKLEVVCDHTDLEIQFPGAMRLSREVKDGQLVATAILGPGLPFAVRWKPQVEKLDAKLVLSSQANTIANVSTGALKMDTLFVFDISQGRLKKLSFSVPQNLSVTQVRGRFIRDWQIEEKGKVRTLSVILNRALTDNYAMQILSEMVLPKFPIEIDLPVIEPERGIHAGGNLAVGTNSAIQLVVKQTAALSQIDAAMFPRIILDRKHPRPLPRSKTFFYTYATSPYQMKLKLDDIIPSYDALERVIVNIREEDLTVNVELDLDVRDAPIREIFVDVPQGFSVTEVTGVLVEKDGFSVQAMKGKPGVERLVIPFTKPVLGRTMIKIFLELGRGPLGGRVVINGFSVVGVGSERGYMVVTTERGVQIESLQPKNLREVHTGSVPMRISGAQFAYRFRDKGWSLVLLAHKKPASIRMESFHLASLGDGILYGTVAVNYFITGAPVDELFFRIPSRYENVEFIGSDVRRWVNDKDRYVVKLQRKVLGDYNLAVSYSLRFKEGENFPAGGVVCEGVETQTGFIVIASHRNLKLRSEDPQPKGVLAIDRNEVPSNYRLLINAPVLKTFKYVTAPHQIALAVSTFKKGTVLPVVNEIVEMRTIMGVRENREAESVTRIRYKVKNSSKQYLSLAIPEGIRIWSTYRIEQDAKGRERAVRVPSSFDQGQLKIPLKRLRNPNDPTTIEIEYGQAHGNLGWRGRINLKAPQSVIRSTFSSWQISVPDDRVIYVGSNMIAEERGVKLGSLALVMRKILSSWRWAMSSGDYILPRIFFGLIASCVLFFVWFSYRSVFPVTVAIIFLFLLVWVGINATEAPDFRNGLKNTNHLSSMILTKALSDDQQPLSLSASIVPAWRAHATLWGSIILPLVSLSCLVFLILMRKQKMVLFSLAISGFVFTAGQFPGLAPCLGHIFTWGIPVCLSLFLLVRVVLRHQLHPGVQPVTALVLLGIFSLVGCNASRVRIDLAEVGNNSFIKRLEYQLKAEQDSMEVTVRLEIDTPEPIRLPLMQNSAVLLTAAKISKTVHVEEEVGKYFLNIERKGKYDVELKFLNPLEKARDDQLRYFHMKVPFALTNKFRLTIPQTGMAVESPTAIQFMQKEKDDSTIAEAMLGPGDELIFIWKPRDRRIGLETTAFYAKVASLIRFDAGMVGADHQIHFQIAQGELKKINIKIPENMIVTSVDGNEVGAWRFDPAGHELEVRLNQPANGDYRLGLRTQIAVDQMPYRVVVNSIQVLAAKQQRGIIGLAVSPSVYIDVQEPLQEINVDDFSRDAVELVSKLAGGKKEIIRHAYRMLKPDAKITVAVNAVLPEIRSWENASFTISDDRLVYNGTLGIEATKAGVFSVAVKIPKNYDIDSLSAAQVSHWDEQMEKESRVVNIHFKKKLLGTVSLKIALSHTESALPKKIAVPKIQVVGALKATGRAIISSDRGVRLSVASRSGVSELNPVELGFRKKGILAFKILKPDWNLILNTEVIRPRINVDFLHVAKVSEGLVRNTHYLRYRLFNAGVKVFEVEVPQGVLGLLVTGPDIAHWEDVQTDGQRRVRIELARKWFDRPYPLTISYESQFDMSDGRVMVEPVKAITADLQKGNLAVYSTERVELYTTKVSTALQPAEARGISRKFGAGDLADAAFCYSSSVPEYNLTVRAVRHGAAKLLEAEVFAAEILTVVTENGETINRVRMKLRVGSKRNLEVTLPMGADIWSLLVNKRSTVPSRRMTNANHEVVMIPLAHAAVGELPVFLDFIYVVKNNRANTSRSQQYQGPRFDLPLKKVSWKFYLPAGYEYYEFDGTLTVNQSLVEKKMFRNYNIRTYEDQIARANQMDLQNAVALQNQGSKLAHDGKQYEAKQALESAWYYSMSDEALNEDTRVQLHKLNRQQAMVGLVGRRGYLRQQTREPFALGKSVVQDLGDQFKQADAERLQNSLSKSDSDNLERITDNIIEVQQAAQGQIFQLAINMPLRGRVLEFTRPLQVNPNTEMNVAFSAKSIRPSGHREGWIWFLGIFTGVFFLFKFGSRAEEKLAGMKKIIEDRASADAEKSAEAKEEDSGQKEGKDED